MRQVLQLRYLPPIHCCRLNNNWRRRNNRSRRYHYWRGGHDSRCRRNHYWRGSYDIAHDGRCSYCRSSDSPSAVVTMMMVVVMVRNGMMMTGASMEARSAVMSTGTGKCETGHSHCCDYYCQFLIHVLLHFLSLLTSWLGSGIIKT